jgi:hypothetical protein
MVGHSEGTNKRGRRADLSLGSLGLVTIVVYGASYYAFSAFIGPISVATGWPEGTLGVVFAGVLVLNKTGHLLSSVADWSTDEVPEQLW